MTNIPVVEPALAYDYLSRALNLLEQPRELSSNSWIRHMEAIDSTGHSVNPESEQAVGWCTIGVVKAVTHYDPNPPLAYKYILSLLNLANPNLLAIGSPDAAPQVNDKAASFTTIQRMFQKAMNLAIRFETSL